MYGKRKNSKNPETGKITTRLRDRADWYYSDGLQEPIISKELFDQAQEIRKRNTRNKPKIYNPNHASVFSGILVCPICGSPMHGGGGRGKLKVNGEHSKSQYYYTCANHRTKKGEYRCPFSKSVKQERVDSLMADIIVHVVNDAKFREDISARIGKAVDTSVFEAQIEKLSEQIRNKAKTLKRKSLVIDDFDWNVDNADAVYDALSKDYLKLQNEIASLERSLGEAKDALEGEKEQKVTQDNVYRFILEFGTVYKKLSEIQKKELAGKFIEKVEIFPEEKEDGTLVKSVTFRFPVDGYGDKGKEEVIPLSNGNNVETVVLISRVEGK